MDFIDKLNAENGTNNSWLKNEDTLIHKAERLFGSVITEFPILKYIKYLPKANELLIKFNNIYSARDDIDELTTNEIMLLSSLISYYTGFRESKYLIIGKDGRVVDEEIECALSELKNKSIVNTDNIVIDLNLLLEAIGYALPEKYFYTEETEEEAYRFIESYLLSYGNVSVMEFLSRISNNLDLGIGTNTKVIYFSVKYSKFHLSSKKEDNSYLPLFFS